MEVVSFMLQWKSIWHLLSWRLGGFQNWSGRFVEEKNLLILPGIEPWILGCPLHSLVTIPTALWGFLWKLSSGKRRWNQCDIALTTVDPVGRHTKKHVTLCCHLHTEIRLCYFMVALKLTRWWCARQLVDNRGTELKDMCTGCCDWWQYRAKSLCTMKWQQQCFSRTKHSTPCGNRTYAPVLCNVDNVFMSF